MCSGDLQSPVIGFAHLLLGDYKSPVFIGRTFLLRRISNPPGRDFNKQNKGDETMDREHALMIVRCYKEAILPLVSDAKVYLYGSCSRNEALKDSDIDVAVVIPKLQGDWLDTTSSLWLATLDINTSIEPVLIEECNPSPLYEDILRNGIAV